MQAENAMLRKTVADSEVEKKTLQLKCAELRFEATNRQRADAAAIARLEERLRAADEHRKALETTLAEQSRQILVSTEADKQRLSEEQKHKNYQTKQVQGLQDRIRQKQRKSAESSARADASLNETKRSLDQALLDLKQCRQHSEDLEARVLALSTDQMPAEDLKYLQQQNNNLQTELDELFGYLIRVETCSSEILVSIEMLATNDSLILKRLHELIDQLSCSDREAPIIADGHEAVTHLLSKIKQLHIQSCKMSEALAQMHPGETSGGSIRPTPC